MMNTNNSVSRRRDDRFVSATVEQDNRPVVTYRAFFDFNSICVGKNAYIYPVNHPDPINVSNEQLAITSKVIAYDAATGAFETKHTRYVLDTSYNH